MPHDTRDQVIDFVRHWREKTELPVARFVPALGLARSKFHDWTTRFGKVNEHNAWVPRDHWLTADEAESIRQFARQNPLEGYRRMAFMMLDQDVVACSPASVYRVLSKAGLLYGPTPSATRKGTGFVQPLGPHEHWHVDVSYLNIGGTFYYLCAVLDGYSRSIVHHEIREQMRETDVETILQRAREASPGATPRVITDNGPQFIARDFKEFIRLAGMSHVRTSPYYPQSNGKIERFHQTLKGESLRPNVPLSLEDARRLTARFVLHYNTIRLHSAIGYVTPQDRLLGRDPAIHAARDQKLAAARERRAELRAQRQQQLAQGDPPDPATPSAASAPPLRPPIDFAALRQAITIAQVLELLGFVPAARNGGQLRGPCPLHGSRSDTARCFSVNTATHAFHCFKCGRGGNALDLWAAAQKLLPYDAALTLCDRLHLPVPTFPPPLIPSATPCPRSDHYREEEPVVREPTQQLQSDIRASTPTSTT